MHPWDALAEVPSFMVLDTPVAVNVFAPMFAVLVVLPSALKENVAAWLIAGAPSERMNVFAEPLTAVVPREPLGLAPVDVETAVPFSLNVNAEMFAVLVVFPSALKENVAA